MTNQTSLGFPRQARDKSIRSRKLSKLLINCCQGGLQLAAAAAVLVHLALGLWLARSHVAQPKVGRCPTVLQLLQRGGATSMVWLLVLGTSADSIQMTSS